MSFDALVVSVRYNYNRLNPFGTGQCLSTEKCFIHLYHNQYVSIPLEQGSVFRQKCQIGLCRPQLSQSLWNRAVSFDEQRVSQAVGYELSQSLWNRAVSFDKSSRFEKLHALKVSIPLEQGSVFRLGNLAGIGQLTRVSIPLEQGSVFRQSLALMDELAKIGLNPFGTGQCLSTDALKKSLERR